MKKITFNNYSTYILGAAASLFLLTNCTTDETDLESNVELTSSSNSALTNNAIISLHSKGGYLSADNTYLKCNRSSVSDDGEKFQVVNNSDGTVSLKSVSRGRYVSSEFTRNTGMTANRTSPGAWEKFKIVDLGSGQVAFTCTYKGSTKFMSSGGGRNDAAFDKTAVGGSWEKFTVGSISNSSSNDSSSSFINTNDGTFDLGAYDIESSSHLSSRTDKKTKTEKDATDTSVFSDHFTKSGGDYYLKSASYDGKRTEWKESGQSSLTTNKTLTYEAEVNDIPSNGVTIAQLHNRGSGVKRPFIRVYIEHGDIYVKETTNDLTNSSGQWDPATKGPAYKEGSKFKVQLTVGNGKLNVKVETTSGTLNKDFTPNVKNSVYNNTYYFKAGVYTEGDDTDPVIRFYSFED